MLGESSTHSLTLGTILQAHILQLMEAYRHPGGELDKPYLHPKGEERGSISSKTHPQAEGGQVAELLQACLGRGHGEAPLGCETNAGGTGWLDTCMGSPIPTPKSFPSLWGTGPHRTPARTGPGWSHGCGLCSQSHMEGVRLELDLQTSSLLKPTGQPHLPGLTGSRFKMQSPISGKK